MAKSTKNSAPTALATPNALLAARETFNKSCDLLFIYDGQYTILNGDPQAPGNNRMDAATERAQTSDVSEKAKIRQQLHQLGHPIYLMYDQLTADFTTQQDAETAALNTILPKKDQKSIEPISGAASRVNYLLHGSGAHYDEIYLQAVRERILNGEQQENVAGYTELLQSLIDSRLFGGVVTVTSASVNMQGAMQFKLLNSSMHKVDAVVNQNSVRFPSSTNNAKGSFGMNFPIPFALMKVQGKVIGEICRQNRVTREDLERAYFALWLGTVRQNSRSKQSMTPRLLLEVVYAGAGYHPDVDTLVDFKSGKSDKSLRSITDGHLLLEKLERLQHNPAVEQVNYFFHDFQEEAQRGDYACLANWDKFKKFTMDEQNHVLRSV